jgi:Cu/Ag efflux protein CusF/cytochrome c5
VKHYFAAFAAIACLVFASQPALPHAQATTTVQFDREIVRILDNHCVMCHAEKALASPLLTYEQTYIARWKIRQGVLDRHMPPWAAVPGYGEFLNDNGLTQREVDFLVSWAESYGPRNNGEVYRGTTVQAPAKPVQARTDFERWELGKPDVLLPIPANRVVDPKLKSERWLRGLEYKPADRRSVRAVSFRVQETGEWIGTWTPWYGFVRFPEGLALRLPAGSHVVADVDQGSLALYFTEKPSLRPISNLVLEAKPAAAAAARKLTATAKLSEDTNLLALEPAIQSGVQSIEVSARLPSGATRVLLFAKDIAPDWPTPYLYRQPVSLPKGTELTVVEHYAGDVARASITFSSYQGSPLPADAPKAQPAPASTQRFEARATLSGTVKSIDADNGRLVVEHGDIPGLMGAMTMSYRVGARENLKKISPGDRIRSDVVVSETGSRLENIEVVRPPK